ncbi:MAG: MoCo/4Fe-4S cofactor protein with predicted Tat translocation signal [Litorivivens sp.]|jgi:MoCo/4Fe-4S cofactor protein with predicted Tat translocation signal
MGKTSIKYWTGIDELENTPEFQKSQQNEFVQDQSIDEFLGDDRLEETNTGRRDFLKFLGFSLTAATLAACETPVVKSIPYVIKPEDITPGVANWYASTYYDGQDYGNILVKAREGRPIFIKGNKEFGMSGGAINSRINTSVLNLYNSARLNGPRTAGKSTDWASLDASVKKELEAARGKVAIIAPTVASPTTMKAINEFNEALGGKLVQYDSVSYSAVRDAHNTTHGKSAIPSYDFSKAKTIVSVACDFLGTWMCSNLFTAQYAQTRRPEGAWMSKHFQFEANMSMTGSNADVRVPVKVSQEALVVAALYNEVTGGGVSGLDENVAAKVKAAAADLKANKGNGLVVCGSNDVNVQRVVNAINEALNNYGTTVNVDHAMNLYQGSEEAMKSLLSEMKSGAVSAVIVYGSNPMYTWPDKAEVAEAFAKVTTSVSFNLFKDETSTACKYLAPDHHYLESWNDLSPVDGRVDLVQPTITPLFNSRYAQESLLNWAGNDADYYTFLRMNHNASFTEANMLKDKAWYTAVHNGTMKQTSVHAETLVEDSEYAVAQASASVSDALAAIKSSAKGGKWELAMYQSIAIGDGANASNPWLQELPDPISKVTWDNYVAMSPLDCAENGINTTIAQQDAASLVKVTANGHSVVLPVFPTPGQKRGTIGIALGYGRGAGDVEIGKGAYVVDGSGEFVMTDGAKTPIGANAMPLTTWSGNNVNYINTDVAIEVTGEEMSLATTQMHNTVMGRTSVVRETTLDAYQAEKDAKKGAASWNLMHSLGVHHDVNGDGEINAQDRESIKNFDLWHEHPVENVGHRWGMTIDLNSCIGCNSCVSACHIENNVPVVGKDEVLRHRDMHWLRIDRFFSSEFETLDETMEETGKGAIGAYAHMEHPAENPQTVHMPMMCQHCNHAPCETVCPVAATTHSNEGLNQMTYNRCIGTRYCANNCPYKVRRFNWFNYPGYKKFQTVNPAQDELSRMVLNPDVVVRSRGVMEKCSMCVQRIQKGKLDSKKEGVPVADGKIVTACAEACPTHAITFGDINDTGSAIRGISENNRAYHVLEEVGAQPNIFYMTKVRNKQDNEA